MTFAELKTDLFRRLQESSSSPTFWSDADLEAALNEGYMEISDATEWHEVWQDVPLLHTRPYYDARLLFGDVELLALGRAFNVRTNRWLDPVSVRDLDGEWPRWEPVIGEPERVMVRGLFWVTYRPLVQDEPTATELRQDPGRWWEAQAPPVDGPTVRQHATALPDPLEADADEPGFQEVFHRGLVEYALSVLLPQVGEVTKALAAWAAYLGYEAGLDGLVNGRGSMPLLQGYAQDTVYSPR